MQPPVRPLDNENKRTLYAGEMPVQAPLPPEKHVNEPGLGAKRQAEHMARDVELSAALRKTLPGPISAAFDRIPSVFEGRTRYIDIGADYTKGGAEKRFEAEQRNAMLSFKLNTEGRKIRQIRSEFRHSIALVLRALVKQANLKPDQHFETRKRRLDVFEAWNRGYAQLAEKTALDYKTVRKAVAFLQEQGFVHVKREPARVNSSGAISFDPFRIFLTEQLFETLGLLKKLYKFIKDFVANHNLRRAQLTATGVKLLEARETQMNEQGYTQTPRDARRRIFAWLLAPPG